MSEDRATQSFVIDLAVGLGTLFTIVEAYGTMLASFPGLNARQVDHLRKFNEMIASQSSIMSAKIAAELSRFDAAE